MTEPTSTYSQPLFSPAEPRVDLDAPRESTLGSPSTQVLSSPSTPIKAEEPRRHPIAYLALGLSIVALLWLTIWSATSGGATYQKVRVGTQDCVSVPQDTGPAALYCRTSGTVK